jgi:hypothetical protein
MSSNFFHARLSEHQAIFGKEAASLSSNSAATLRYGKPHPWEETSGSAVSGRLGSLYDETRESMIRLEFPIYRLSVRVVRRKDGFISSCGSRLFEFSFFILED